MKKDNIIQTLDFFKNNFWREANRFNSKGELIQTVTITEENFENLFNSQFEDKTVYGTIFTYSF